jgi:hypothetical protein
MFDFSGGSIGIGDYQISIGGGGSTYPYIIPGTNIPVTLPGSVPTVYQVPANNSNQQIIMIGLVLLAVVLLTRK